jgi:hypothetical protein
MTEVHRGFLHSLQGNSWMGASIRHLPNSLFIDNRTIQRRKLSHRKGSVSFFQNVLLCYLKPRAMLLVEFRNDFVSSRCTTRLRVGWNYSQRRITFTYFPCGMLVYSGLGTCGGVYVVMTKRVL